MKLNTRRSSTKVVERKGRKRRMEHLLNKGTLPLFQSARKSGLPWTVTPLIDFTKSTPYPLAKLNQRA
ncbi:hypothetical protein NSND_50581 [Nitrospira sp. ND1]|nr:hypothetical protein NSND_50581 [Nitrospira sp. ND1]